MAKIVWTEPAVSDLDAIADYIALDNPAAARQLVQRVFEHVEQLERYPESGSIPPELRALAIAKSSKRLVGSFIGMMANVSWFFTSFGLRDGCDPANFEAETVRVRN